MSSLSVTGPGRDRCRGVPKPDAFCPDGGRRGCTSRGRCARMEAWRAAKSGLRRAMCWRSSVMRFAGSTGLADGVSSSPGILRGSLYTSSATDLCMSSLNAMRIPRRTRGSASVSVHCQSAWHMMAAFSVRWKRSTTPLAAGCWVVVREN
jgi:hypothetical protein